MNDTPTPSSPIADLTYRGYSGPLRSHVASWWIIAVAMVRLTMKKKGFWALAAVAAAPYIFQGIALYLRAQVSEAQGMDPMNMLRPAAPIDFARTFYAAAGFQLLFLFLAGLMAGAGTIAADNQTNALQVYLSKPVTKGDYLLGKWMGVFLSIWPMAFVPALLLYLNCVVSYASNGFLTNDPWLAARVLAATLVPAVLHASIVLGISAWCKTPRIAGAVYAGLYFVGGQVAAVTAAFTGAGARIGANSLVPHLSINGVILGLLQNIFNVTLQSYRFSHRAGVRALQDAPPDLLPMLALGAALALAGILAGRFRIRAVEVVRG